jgi:hypothetical protein
MDYDDAIFEILRKARTIKLPRQRLDVVTIARREFAKHGSCDAKFIAPIEETVRGCLRSWTLEQKSEIWLSTETAAESDHSSGDYDDEMLDMVLEDELLYYLIEELSPRNNQKKFGVREAQSRFRIGHNLRDQSGGKPPHSKTGFCPE